MAINDSAMQLSELGVDLEQEDDAADFLGVTLEQDPETSLLKMKQTRLIKRIIEALGLDDGAKRKVYSIGVQTIGQRRQWRFSKWSF